MFTIHAIPYHLTTIPHHPYLHLPHYHISLPISPPPPPIMYTSSYKPPSLLHILPPPPPPPPDPLLLQYHPPPASLPYYMSSTTTPITSIYCIQSRIMPSQHFRFLMTSRNFYFRKKNEPDPSRVDTFTKHYRAEGMLF